LGLLGFIFSLMGYTSLTCKYSKNNQTKIIRYFTLNFICYSSIRQEFKKTSMKFENILGMYSCLQIVECMYNNYFSKSFWPMLLQLGVLSVCIPVAICVTKWKLVSNDPRLVLMFLALTYGWLVTFVATKYGSKLHSGSVNLLQTFCRIKFSPQSSRYYRRRIKCRHSMAVKVANNFMDAEMPLSITSFCISNIISLLQVLK